MSIFRKTIRRILDALKKLVVKRGGTPKGSNIAEVIDDLAETSSGGDGVITLDYDSLIQTEKTVDFMDAGEVVKDVLVCLYDIDPNSQYRIYMHDDIDNRSAFNLALMIENKTVSECLDTVSEDFELAETISGEVPFYIITCIGDIYLYIVPTTTQFKTYKRFVDR